MKNELQIVNEINKRGELIRKPRLDEKPIFPLTPTHRKELRQLKADNCGNLQTRLQTIRSLKKDEFVKKYDEKIQKQLEAKTKVYKSSIVKVEKAYKKIFDSLKTLYEEQQSLRSTFDGDDFINLSNAYAFKQIFNNVNNLELNIKNENQKIVTINFNIDTFKRRMLDEMFSKQFGEHFKQCESMIDSLQQQYEEAINFGDLEQVKELYYFMKDSEKFFEKVSNIEV